MIAITSRHVISYILKCLRPYPFGVSALILTALFWSLDISIRPYILKNILNNVTEIPSSDQVSIVWTYAVYYLIMSFLMSSVFRIYGYFVEYKMIPEMRKKTALEALQNLLSQSHSFYQNRFSGSLANKVNQVTESVPEIIQITFDRFLSLFLVLTIAIVTLSQVNIAFALCMLGWAGVFIVGSIKLSPYLTQLSGSWSEKGSLLTGKIVDILSNILSVRFFTTKKAELEILDKAAGEAVIAEKKLQWVYFWIWFVYGYSFFLSLGLNFYFLIKGWREGWVTVGDFALVLMINISIGDFLWQFAREFARFSTLFGRIAQVLRDILSMPEIQDSLDAKELVVTKGKIQFDKVNFQYKKADLLFHNKSITINPGEKIGLVGYSGGGKTTFVNLILRLYDVTSGQILIDGQDIRLVTQASLHQAISMIPQDPSLFHRSIKDNISYGSDNASDDAIIEAAKRAHAHDFITAMPDSYESLVGERGVKLSGGQRQRLAIARAILKNAPILILDEATSQLDSLTETKIQASLKEAMQGKTTIVIAHRLSTLFNMDRIFVFDQGKIVEIGSHSELIQREGLYKNLWDKQVGGFLQDGEDS